MALPKVWPSGMYFFFGVKGYRHPDRSRRLLHLRHLVELGFDIVLETNHI